MLETHVSKDGPMPIASMDDGHLTNTVRLFLRQAMQVRSAATNQPADKFTRKLYNIPVIDEETAAEAVRRIIVKLYPYLAEMWLRSLQDEDAHSMLVELIGRDSQLEEIIAVPLLPGNAGSWERPEY